jgi:hypothetical protein
MFIGKAFISSTKPSRVDHQTDYPSIPNNINYSECDESCSIISHVVDDENVQHESQFVVTTIYDTYRDNPNASSAEPKTCDLATNEDDRVIEFTLFILFTRSTSTSTYSMIN